MGLFGHIGLGLAFKKVAPRILLWILLLSTMVIDIPAIIFFSAPLWITHSLFMAAIWSLTAMGIAAFISLYLNSRDPSNEKITAPIKILNTSLVIGFLLFSHWIIDFIGWSMTSNSIPLFFNDSQTIMLDIQTNIIIAALIMEIGPLIAGLTIYILYLKRR